MTKTEPRSAGSGGGRDKTTPTDLLAALTRLYASGYASGHHDTVEGVYTDVVYVDRGEYHRDVVEELLADSDYAALTTLSAREDAPAEQVLQLLIAGGFVDPWKAGQARAIIANAQKPKAPTAGERSQHG